MSSHRQLDSESSRDICCLTYFNWTRSSRDILIDIMCAQNVWLENTTNKILEYVYQQRQLDQDLVGKYAEICSSTGHGLVGAMYAKHERQIYQHRQLDQRSSRDYS